MKHETNPMKLHNVYDKVDTSTLSDDTIREAIPTRWVLGPPQERFVAF